VSDGYPFGMANTGHGHVQPRPDGVKARCGGPGMCAECRRERANLPMAPEPEDSEAAWADWFEAQHDLCRAIDDALDRTGEGKSDGWHAALISSLMEHLAERQRRYIKLPSRDETLRPEPG
jgi:hypothetical protein